MWSGLNFTVLGVVLLHTDLHATRHALDISLDSCTTVHQGLQRRLTCCLQLVAEGSHTTGERTRATWQREPDFWDFCLFFWVFHRIQLNIITFQDITWLTLLLSFYLLAWPLTFEGMGTQEPRVLDAVVSKISKTLQDAVFCGQLTTTELTSESAAESSFFEKNLTYHFGFMLICTLCLSIYVGKNARNAHLIQLYIHEYRF